MIGELIDKLIAPLAPTLALRRLDARERLRMLSIYAAAARDRTRRDWNPKNTSADRAVIDDMPTLNARARAIVRDSSAGVSIPHAFTRKVVGTGITIVPTARDAKGNDLRAFNDEIADWWQRWSHDPSACDIEGKKTLTGFQRLAARELPTVGQHFVIRSYRKHKDLPGLVLQAAEPEQLDTTRIHNHATNHEIRGGIEIDEHTRPVAYHFYRRHPDDRFQAVHESDSQRVPAERVDHILDVERVRQTQGATWMAPVLRKLRDTDEYDTIQLWTARLEACIGLIRKRGKSYGSATSGLAGPATETGVDAHGNAEINFAPGMVADIESDGELKPFVPERPGGQYDPFITRQLKSIAAGARISYEQLTRDFHQGTYSSQRQGSLEDNCEFDWITQLLVDCWLRNLWHEFVTILFLEGRITTASAEDFFANPIPYLRFEWQGPPRPWIDPLKEAQAETHSLLWGLNTRKRILNRRGETLRETLQQLADEHRLAEELGIRLPDLQGDPEASATELDDAPPVASDEEATTTELTAAGRLSGVNGRARRW